MLYYCESSIVAADGASIRPLTGVAWEVKQTKSKIILLTGGASGIGAAIARLAIGRNHRVHIADINLEGAQSLARSIGPNASATGLDVRSPEAWTRVLDETWAAFGRLDVLINNAGIAHAGYANEVPLAKHERTVEVNFMGPMRGMLATLPRFLAQGSGHFLTVCSMTAFLPYPGLSSYAAAKHALRAFHHALALEQRASALKFTIVYPGSTETPMLDQEAQSGLALAFASPSRPAEEVGTIVLDAMEKEASEVYIPKERAQAVRRIGTNPRALLEMVIRGEAAGAERLKERLAARP